MNVGETEPASSPALLRVRTARPGERFAPLGMNGRTRPVRDVMAGVLWPPALRETCPVVAREDTGEILWIVGLAQAETTRVTPLSKRLVRLVAEPNC